MNGVGKLARCFIRIAASVHLFAALAIMSATTVWGETVCYFSGGTWSGNNYTKGPRIETGKKYPLANSLSMSAWVRVSPNITTVKPYGPTTGTGYFGAAIAGQGFYGGEKGFGLMASGWNTNDPNNADKTNDAVSYQVRITGSGTVITSDSYKDATLFTADEWHHYLVVRDKTAGKARFYVDGKLFSEKDCPSSWDLTATKDFAIACNMSTAGGTFCGYIADVALWNVALSAAEAARLPSVGVNGVSTAPIAYFPLDEGSGNTVHETVNSTSHTATGGNLVWVDDPYFIRAGAADILHVVSSPGGIGSPTPAYGVTNGLAAGASFTVSCGAAVTNATGSAYYCCTGWKLYNENGEVVSNGTEASFTYVHPNPAAYRRLVWQWRTDTFFRYGEGTALHGYQSYAEWLASANVGSSDASFTAEAELEARYRTMGESDGIALRTDRGRPLLIIVR